MHGKYLMCFYGSPYKGGFYNIVFLMRNVWALNFDNTFVGIAQTKQIKSLNQTYSIRIKNTILMNPKGLNQICVTSPPP